MKKFLVILILLSMSLSIFAVDYIDVVEKKDGSILKGVIIENVINDYVKVELLGGSVFVIKYDEIIALKREKSQGSDGNNIVINNNNNASNVSARDLDEYSYLELNAMLNGLNLSELKKLELDSYKIRNTSDKTKNISYARSKADDSGIYAITNWLLPGIGSFWQGDTGSGAGTVVANLLGWTAFCFTYVGYIDESNKLVYPETSSSGTDSYAAGMLLSLAFIAIYDTVQIFLPFSYEKKYNKELKNKLELD